MFFGADDGARTRYLHLGKVALYQMSYIRIFGASGRNRTIDTGIFSPLLYRLSYRATCLLAERACGVESIILFPILQPQNIIFSTSLYFAALHSRNPPSQSGGSLRQNTAQQQWENQRRPG